MLVIAENLTQFESNQWVEVGLPLGAKPRVVKVVSESGQEQEGYIDPSGVLLFRPKMAPTSKARFTVQDVDGDPQLPPFNYSDWILDDLRRAIPKFFLELADGTKVQAAEVEFTAIDTNPRRVVWHLLATFASAQMPIQIEGWFNVYHEQDVVEFVLRFTASTTRHSNILFAPFRSLSMLIGERVKIDWANQKGLHQPMWRTDVAIGELWWEVELVAPQSWLRAGTFEVRGAVLCLPPEDRFGQLPGNPRVTWIQARDVGPTKAILSAADWEGKFLAFGTLPKQPLFVDQEERFRSFLARYNSFGSAQQPRPYAQPPISETTGQQADFGAVRGEHAVVMQAPWAIHDLLFSVEAWALRCYAHREANGSPMQHVMHPGLQTTSMRVDSRFGSDMLGWPAPVPYFQNWNTSDNEHRSDNLLWAMWMLTRDPSIKRTIEDMLELQAADLLHLGPPRAMGRVLLSLSHAHACGFEAKASKQLRKAIEMAWQLADYRRQTPGQPVKAWSTHEWKYGWLNSDGSPIVSHLPWQESILAIGLAAAYRVTGDQRLLEMIKVICKTIADYGFFKENGAWHCCYAVRWSPDGQPMPVTSYTTRLPNYDVFVYDPMAQWTLPALQLLVQIEPHARASEILAAYPINTWDDSCWRAVVASGPAA